MAPVQCIRYVTVLLMATLVLFGFSANASSDRQLEILGWIETVQLAPTDMEIQAKLDTGADNSSLNAPDAEEFERDGDTWVRFNVENDDGRTESFEKPVHRMVRIRSAAGLTRRYVVKMTICMAGIQREVEVNLADRTDLSYQMLIGRSYLKDHILVDSGRKNTLSPACETEVPADKETKAKTDDDPDDEGQAEDES